MSSPFREYRTSLRGRYWEPLWEIIGVLSLIILLLILRVVRASMGVYKSSRVENESNKIHFQLMMEGIISLKII